MFTFDWTKRPDIFEIMKQMGIPDSYLQWTKLGFIDTQASVILNGSLSDPFPLTGGARQGGACEGPCTAGGGEEAQAGSAAGATRSLHKG